MAWPIDDPALVERLTLDDDAFRAMIGGFVEALELPPYDDAFYERAIAYPWSRPTGSYALDGDEVHPLDPVRALEIGGLTARASLADADSVDGAGAHGRMPLLAIGSNGAPSTLVRKFAHLPPHERRLLVVAGHLHGYDVGPAARVTPYGSLPATLFVSPGTEVRASVLWVTPAQLVALTWSEMSYLIGWLGPASFAPDEPPEATGTPAVTQALVYVSRWGTLTCEGAPIALDALPARGRSAVAWNQARLLDLLATEAGTGAADGRALLRHLAEQPADFMDRLEPWLDARAARFATKAWHPFPAEPPRAA